MAWAIFRPRWWSGDEQREQREALKATLVARAGRAQASRLHELVDSLPISAVRVMEGLTGTALGDWGTGGDPELRGYTRLTGQKNGKLVRDLTPMSQEQQAQVGHFLYESNPLAGWMIDQRVDLLVPAEVGYTVELDAKRLKITEEQAKEKAVEIKDALDKFWEHPAHNVRFRAHEYVVTLMVTGELCLVIGDENVVTGVPTLDYVDSQMISGVEPLEKSCMVPGTVLIRRKLGDGSDPIRKAIVRPGGGKPGQADEELDEDRLGGECFYWRNSRILNAMRGRGELMRPADFLDGLDQFMFTAVDKAILQNNLVWDVTLENATEVQLIARTAQLKKEFGKPGGVFVHNEKGTLVAASPDLKAADASETQRMLANHIRGSKSMPESWYADGGNANRATSGDQTDVAYKTLESWQTRIRLMLNTLLWYAYDNLADLQSGETGFPKRSEGVKINVDLPPVRERDAARAATTLTQTEGALEAGVEAEFVSRKTAARVFQGLLEKLTGLAIDSDEEQERIDAEEADREEAKAEQANMFARDALDAQLQDDPDEEQPGATPPGKPKAKPAPVGVPS